jgi:fatty-acyl-CoA synthase
VIGQPHEKWGERPVALVVLREGAKQEETERSIREFLGRFVEKGTISKWWIPDRIVFVDEIPKTSVGKINKKEIRKRFTQGV